MLDLKKNEDIDYYDPEINISVSSGGIWAGNGGLIKSTLKRKEKLEQIERDNQKNQPTFQTTFHAPFTGNFNQGDTEGSLQTFNEPQKSDKPKWLTWNFYWEEIVKFGWKYVIVAAIAAISTYLGVKFVLQRVKYHPRHHNPKCKIKHLY